MKTINTKIKNHLQGEVTTIARCWIIEKNDGSKIGFTDHDSNLEIEGVICERDAGVESANVEERIGLNVNTTEVSGALQSDYIEAVDINAGLYDNARVSIYVVNWQSPSEYFLDHVYLVGVITREDGLYRMELRGLLSKLDQTQGNHFITRCQANLGDAKCRVNLNQNGFSAIAEISFVQSPLLVEVTGLETYEVNWFKDGRLTWLDGANLGSSVQLAEHTKTSSKTILQFWQSLSFSPSIGERFKVEVGCDKQFVTCKQKFSNPNNFRGFPHMPGSEIILGNVSTSNNFDGGPIIP